LATSPWHEDTDSTADYLRYGYCLPGYTSWLQVREVLPGHFLRWQADEPGVRAESYWRLKPRQFSGTKENAAERLRETVERSVKHRLVADVEVGAFLSGGIDSSLICAIARRNLGQPLKTFTIGFDDPSFDERRYAQRAASHFGTEHFEEVLPDFSPRDLEQLLLLHLGSPFQDPSLLPTALVSSIAARHVKVALSGDGGDELFCGYQRYQARAILRWYTRLPVGLRGALQQALRSFPEPDQHHSRSLIKKAHLFCEVADRLDEETPYVAPVMLERSLRLQVAPDIVDRGHPPPGLPEATQPDDIASMMLSDALIYLPQDILTKVDRASMAASLEVRAPLLDRAVVELAFSLPRLWHRHGLNGKRMLKLAFGDLLPSWIWKRRKQGFGVPLHAWFRGDLGNVLEQRLRDTPLGPLNSQGVFDLLRQHRSGRRDLGQRLWLIHAYVLWRSQAQ
jgi:asparagine synthase (glutamine-hydrolysing)